VNTVTAASALLGVQAAVVVRGCGGPAAVSYLYLQCSEAVVWKGLHSRCYGSMQGETRCITRACVMSVAGVVISGLGLLHLPAWRGCVRHG
jgi:hypothetical protein